MFYLHCTTIISLILTFTCKYSAYSSMFIQFYIFWNSAILENNLRDLPSPRAPALQARKRFLLVLLRAFRSVTSRKSKACTEDLELVWKFPCKWKPWDKVIIKHSLRENVNSSQSLNKLIQDCIICIIMYLSLTNQNT